MVKRLPQITYLRSDFSPGLKDAGGKVVRIVLEPWQQLPMVGQNGLKKLKAVLWFPNGGHKGQLCIPNQGNLDQRRSRARIRRWRRSK